MNKNYFLVVDDDSEIRNVIREVLERTKYADVLEAENGKVAMDIIGSQKIIAIISDLQMPVMNGLELLNKIRGDARFKEIPFLMISGAGLSESGIDIIKTRVNDFVEKPFSIKLLIQKIENLTKK